MRAKTLCLALGISLFLNILMITSIQLPKELPSVDEALKILAGAQLRRAEVI